MSNTAPLRRLTAAAVWYGSPPPIVNPVVAVIIVSAISGVLAALVAMVISTVTAGTLSPLAGVAIGAAFGVTAGTFVRASSDTRRGQRWAIALLRGVVAGITAGLTIFLVHRR